MTAVTYLEGRLRDHRGEQECILILSTAESLPQMPWSRKKLRKVYPVWCSLLPQQTPTKKLRKKLGGPSKFFRGPDPRISPVVAPMLLMLPQRCDQLLEIERCYWARYARFTSPARHDKTVLSVLCLVYRSHRLKRHSSCLVSGRRCELGIRSVASTRVQGWGTNHRMGWSVGGEHPSPHRVEAERTEGNQYWSAAISEST